MAPPVVRANYDELSQIAGQFAQNADLTRQTLLLLRSQQDTLRGGDWVGQGAQAFYNEMDSQVLPTFSRLINALQQAAVTTRQISQAVHAAEDQAAAVLKANSNGAGAPAGGAGSPNGMAFGPMAGPNGSGGGGGGSKDKRPIDDIIMENLADANPQLAEAVKKNPALQRQIERLGEAGWWIDKGATGDIGVDYGADLPTITIGPKATVASLNKAVNRISKDPAILENIGLDPKVAAQVKKDPLLMAELRRMGEDEYGNWKISLSSQSGVSSINYSHNKAQIDPDPKNQLASLKETVWKAQRDKEEEWAGEPGKPRGSIWVDINVDNRLTNDANEFLAKSAAYHDTYNKPLPWYKYPAGVATNHLDQYNQIASEYANGNLSQGQAAMKIVEIMNSEPDKNMAVIYKAYYENMLPPATYTPWPGTKPP